MLERIIMHWTAGGHKANAIDKAAYHEIVEGDGDRVRGAHLPAANLSLDGGHYAAHTRGFNRGSVGLSVAAMSGAKDRPFTKGRYPIPPVQLDAFVTVVAEYADTYGIEVTRETVLTHAEVPLTHGIAQPGKWDIRWLPDMADGGDPLEVGDHLRMLIAARKRELFDGGGSVLAGVDSDDFVNALSARVAEAVRDTLKTFRG